MGEKTKPGQTSVNPFDSAKARFDSEKRQQDMRFRVLEDKLRKHAFGLGRRWERFHGEEVLIYVAKTPDGERDLDTDTIAKCDQRWCVSSAKI